MVLPGSTTTKTGLLQHVSLGGFGVSAAAAHQLDEELHMQHVHEGAEPGHAHQVQHAAIHAQHLPLHHCLEAGVPGPDQASLQQLQHPPAASPQQNQVCLLKRRCTWEPAVASLLLLLPLLPPPPLTDTSCEQCQ